MVIAVNIADLKRLPHHHVANIERDIIAQITWFYKISPVKSELWNQKTENDIHFVHRLVREALRDYGDEGRFTTDDGTTYALDLRDPRLLLWIQNFVRVDASVEKVLRV